MDTWFSQQSNSFEHVKAVLGRVIIDAVEDRGLDCDTVAELLITDCSAIEDLFRQQLERFSLSTLVRYAGALNIPLISLDEALTMPHADIGMQGRGQ